MSSKNQPQNDAAEAVTKTERSQLEVDHEKLKGTVDNLVKTVNFLSAQLQHLYLRLQLAPLDISQIRQNTDWRTETGMGPHVSADKTNYV